MKSQITATQQATEKLTDEMQNCQIGIKAYIDQQIAVAVNQNMKNEIEKQVTQVSKDHAYKEWKSEQLYDIDNHCRKLLFFNVKEDDDHLAEEWVKKFITDHTLSDEQRKGMKFTHVKVFDKLSHNNRRYHTRNVQVSFTNEHLKRSIFLTLIKENKIEQHEHLQHRPTHINMMRILCIIIRIL